MYSDLQTLWRVTIERNPNSYMPHYNLGILLHHDGRLDEALLHYRRAIEIQPDSADAHNNLGNLLLQGGSVQEAIVELRLAAAIRPGHALTQINLGNALSQAGQTQEAVACYQAAVNAQPTNAFFLNNLAWVRAANPDARFRNGPEAVRLAEQACRATGFTEPILIGTLAAAYAEAGRFDEAVAAAQKAQERAQLLAQPSVVRKNRELIQLFKTRQPYRDTTPLAPANQTP
jgi:tetratricopeptide (TPR) repeat protein